jgi:hypothetical protein
VKEIQEWLKTKCNLQYTAKELRKLDMLDISGLKRLLELSCRDNGIASISALGLDKTLNFYSGNDKITSVESLSDDHINLKKAA